MTVQERLRNTAATSDLVRGGVYKFSPPVEATGIPTGGPQTCDRVMLEFEEGWYIGFIDGNHVFQGRPINDARVIPTPPGYEQASNLEEIRDQLRTCYFPVLFIGGSTVELIRAPS